MSDKKIRYISILQIIGPIFVVLGHSLNGLDATGVWYKFSKEWIYIFHMPLFFMISGYLLAYKGYSCGSYKNFVCRKAKRLLIPYFVWNFAFWIPKIFVQQYVSDGASLDVFGMVKAFVFPRQNIWGHTWFLLGLFIVFLATPLFKKVLGTKRPFVTATVLIVCCILYTLPITTHFLAFSDIRKDLLFFVIGCLLGQLEYDKFASIMSKYRIGFVVGAIAFSIVSLLWYEETRILRFIPCAFILMAFLSLATLADKLPPFCEKIASYSFGIYIMHWPVMIVVRILMHQILGINVLFTATAMSILGYVVPIIVITLIRSLPFDKIKKPLKYLLGV